MGNGRFEDSRWDGLCRDLGCFNSGNHMTYLRGTGNHINKSKDGKVS